MTAEVESILSQTKVTDETKHFIRSLVSALLMGHRPREVLSKVDRAALRELKAEKHFFIVPANKGLSLVILDRTAYLQKAKGLLEDRQSYVPCATIHIKTLVNEINATFLAFGKLGSNIIGLPTHSENTGHGIVPILWPY
ncbi:unnamed protein product [Schistocephalus solidus]|uniref:DUF302 domain-containing protein n=1 Tax=Schistocephalus solidus TaxID=70667 RepID=A0A183T7D0_SCHSO|nr:unnamed protein product [Schistocephalus solidus]